MDRAAAASAGLTVLAPIRRLSGGGAFAAGLFLSPPQIFAQRLCKALRFFVIAGGFAAHPMASSSSIIAEITPSP